MRYIKTSILQIGKKPLHLESFRKNYKSMLKPGYSTLKKTLRFSYDTLPSNGGDCKKKKKEVQRLGHQGLFAKSEKRLMGSNCL